MANFQKAYAITREKWEGGYANLPQDKGGETYAGISRVKFPDSDIWVNIDFAKRTKYQSGIPHNTFFPDIEYLVVDHYLKLWNKYSMDNITDNNLAALIFDYIIHSGTTAIKNIQNIVGTTPDGIFGPKTRNAINIFDPGDLYVKILRQRKDFLNRLANQDSSQEIFREGWMNRIQFFAELNKMSVAGISSGVIGIILAILFLIFLFFNR